MAVFDHRENGMIRSYNELIKCVPLLEDLSEQGDAESLEALYQNVSSHLAALCAFNTAFSSCAKDPTWPGLMIRAISKSPSLAG